MNGETYISPKKAREMLGVTNDTLRNWDKKNRIRVSRGPSGRRMYNLEDINRVINGSSNAKEKRKICYARVSSKKQMDDLNRQENLFKHKYPHHILVTDVGSGINWKRKGLWSILEQSMSREIEEVVVAHRDRLSRFGFDLFKGILERNGTKLVVLDDETGKSPEQELSDDVLAILHVYSCKRMGTRRYSLPKDQNFSKPTTEENSETVDGNNEIRLQ